METPISGVLKELNDVIAEFNLRYTALASKNQQFIGVESDVQEAIKIAQKKEDIKESAQIFSAQIFAIMRNTEQKQQLSSAKWTGKLGTFLSKLYPVANVALRLTGSIAEVVP